MLVLLPKGSSLKLNHSICQMLGLPRLFIVSYSFDQVAQLWKLQTCSNQGVIQTTPCSNIKSNKLDNDFMLQWIVLISIEWNQAGITYFQCYLRNAQGGHTFSNYTIFDIRDLFGMSILIERFITEQGVSSLQVTGNKTY